MAPRAASTGPVEPRAAEAWAEVASGPASELARMLAGWASGTPSAACSSAAWLAAQMKGLLAAVPAVPRCGCHTVDDRLLC